MYTLHTTHQKTKCLYSVIVYQSSNYTCAYMILSQVITQDTCQNTFSCLNEGVNCIILELSTYININQKLMLIFRVSLTLVPPLLVMLFFLQPVPDSCLWARGFTFVFTCSNSVLLLGHGSLLHLISSKCFWHEQLKHDMAC